MNNLCSSQLSVEIFELISYLLRLSSNCLMQLNLYNFSGTPGISSLFAKQFHKFLQLQPQQDSAVKELKHIWCDKEHNPLLKGYDKSYTGSIMTIITQYS